ncbi:hypothetical protein [Acidithiobacillus thiooxidans]|uniref:hypothetical protein n=1 Tax=Acidithiobacillus thiooxidans TaxID=930 RepID=UPI00130134A7|nr:hypothetical protein [Acidithiobacillus thiooxidans]
MNGLKEPASYLCTGAWITTRPTVGMNIQVQSIPEKVSADAGYREGLTHAG